MAEFTFQSGFGNHFATEALKNALPIGQNSPQTNAYGLYAEQLNGSAFTATRHLNKRSWLYRILPSVVHGEFQPYPDIQLAPMLSATPPNQMRWAPLAQPTASNDFIHGWQKMADNRGPYQHLGAAIYLYQCNSDMIDTYFYNADGELLIIPQQGLLTIRTEFGPLQIGPGDIALIPRGCKFQVLVSEQSRGYICENHGQPFQLPELGPIGSNGLANARDFHAPVADYEVKHGDFRLICKFQDRYYQAKLDHSPLNVVAWHGNLTPFQYKLSDFNTVNTVSFDHPDPSIFTVLTSPGVMPGIANLDFVIFPERWMVAEHSFRPPYYHRNVMSEYMGLIRGEYDAKGEGFVPFGGSLHNAMSAHGPDKQSYQTGSTQPLSPVRYEGTLAFMLESSQIWQITQFAWECQERDRDYLHCWEDLPMQFKHV